MIGNGPRRTNPDTVEQTNQRKFIRGERDSSKKLEAELAVTKSTLKAERLEAARQQKRAEQLLRAEVKALRGDLVPDTRVAAAMPSSRSVSTWAGTSRSGASSATSTARSSVMAASASRRVEMERLVHEFTLEAEKTRAAEERVQALAAELRRMQGK